MIHPDKSITEIYLNLNYAVKILDLLRYKSPDNPLSNEDYHKLYQAIDIIESVTYCRWIKEYY